METRIEGGGRIYLAPPHGGSKAPDNVKVTDETGKGYYIRGAQYYLKLQQADMEETLSKNGVDIRTDDTEMLQMTGMELRELYDTKYSERVPVLWSPDLGLYSPNIWLKDKTKTQEQYPKKYELKIMAPEQEEYEISIRRYYGPIPTNQKIRFTIPKAGSGE
ncbi:hypothetical protein [Brevibacillus daliensis]|uniref:hypothetical protein n=1 Tax=Brevibacillus daliensis TaxID=2892995 RepID=UPI001E5422CF|nr:hypothetical protein [Brevibacillus daliensis]